MYRLAPLLVLTATALAVAQQDRIQWRTDPAPP
jgi:hypothetical protein